MPYDCGLARYRSCCPKTARPRPRSGPGPMQSRLSSGLFAVIGTGLQNTTCTSTPAAFIIVMLVQFARTSPLVFLQAGTRAAALLTFIEDALAWARVADGAGRGAAYRDEQASAVCALKYSISHSARSPVFFEEPLHKCRVHLGATSSALN